MELLEEKEILLGEKNITLLKNFNRPETETIIKKADLSLERKSKLNFEKAEISGKTVSGDLNEIGNNLNFYQKINKDNIDSYDNKEEDVNFDINQNFEGKLFSDEKKKNDFQTIFKICDLNYSENSEKIDNPIKEVFKLYNDNHNGFKLESALELNEDLSKVFETQKKVLNSEEKSKSENIESSEFFSRYNTLDKSSGLLSYKRKREQLIKESYESFGFSFDSALDFKKGLSKVEKEKLIEKNKRDNEILTNIEINSKSIISKNEANQNIIISETKEAVKKTIITSNNFMQDAKINKTRVEREKELFLEEQKKLKEKQNPENKPANEENNPLMETTNINFLNYKQRKQALLDSSINGKYFDSQNFPQNIFYIKTYY